MIVRNVKITNYKGLKIADVAISRFTTLIGENNTGKSSLLQALLLFVKGTKLDSSNFFDPTRDITIELYLDELDETALSALAEEHRNKIRDLVDNQTLRLVRRYQTDGSSSLRVIQNVPTDSRFSPDEYKAILKGKKGKDIVTATEECFPELASKLGGVTTQSAAVKLIEELSASVPASERRDVDVALPTGLDNSIKAILPEPVYIPAVKDLQDDIKTKESASFGKLLSILLNVIDSQLSDARETFAHLEKQLNRVEGQDGVVIDERLEEVKEIESTLAAFVKESFANVTLELRIPPPEIKTVLSNAKILADDGVVGEIESKGDGLKRAITFAILRSYVELSRDPKWQARKAQASLSAQSRYLFLFEEPELYLHPKAQHALFDALGQISREHQVLLSTHSPIFFAPGSTSTFVKMAKRDDGVKPRGHAMQVDLEEMSAKEQFQLICYDNNSAAFFADAVLLVEGDSDYLVAPHIAKTLNEDWDFARGRIAMIRVNGKSSIRRYREFFARFDMRVMVLTDLDILVSEFDKLDASPDATRARSDLLQSVDRLVPASDEQPITADALRELPRSGALRQAYERAGARWDQREKDDAAVQDTLVALHEVFAHERKSPRMAILRDARQSGILEEKRRLLRQLRAKDVFVLERGAIEDYYPESVPSADKPTRAQKFCELVTTKEEMLALCDTVPVDDSGRTEPEFVAIFGRVFSCSVGKTEKADASGSVLAAGEKSAVEVLGEIADADTATPSKRGATDPMRS